MYKLTFIIPTRNRINSLSILLNSIDMQTIQPFQIIIVDGSDEPVKEALTKKTNAAFDYIRVYPPSLTKQRNAGVKAVKKEATLIGYLDDDIVLEKDAVEKMLMFWEKSTEDIGGASFNIVNNEISKPHLLSRFFGMRSKIRGKVLPSGFHTIIEPIQELTQSEWLCGGATIWRRNILNEFKYDEWYEGASYFEDFDFSYQVCKKYKLYVLRDSRVQHNPPPFIPQKCSRVGEMYMTYRYYFVKKHFHKTFPIFYWSSIGLICSNLGFLVTKRKSMYFYHMIGNIIGIFKLLFRSGRGITDEFRQGEKTTASLL